MSSVRRPRGRLFQIRGPAAPKLLSPKLLCVRGTAYILSKEDRRDRRLPSETRQMSSATRQIIPNQPRGRLFQIHGPAAPKLLSRKLLCVRGTAHMLSKKDRRDRRLPSETRRMSSATRQIIPNSQTGSSKVSVSEAVVRTWHRTHVVKGRPEGPSVAFRNETDVISHEADYSKFADRQLQSFCLGSCCAYVAPHTFCQRKTAGTVGCLQRRDRCHQPRGRLFQIHRPAAPKLLSRKLLCIRVAVHMLSKEDRRDRRLPSETKQNFMETSNR